MSNVKTPKMDNSATARHFGYEGRLEEPADIFRSFGTDAIMLAVRLRVRFAVSDQNAPFAPGFQQRGQRLSDATTIGKDQPACLASWRGRLSCRELFGPPLELIKPVAETIDNRALFAFVQEIKAEPLNLDRHASCFIEELYFSRCGIRVPMLHSSVTP
jgi:hypothetical protein